MTSLEWGFHEQLNQRAHGEANWEKDFLILGKVAMPHWMLTLEILITCVLICSKSSQLITLLCSVEGTKQETKKRSSSETGHYVNNSMPYYFLGPHRLSKQPKCQLTPQRYFYLTVFTLSPPTVHTLSTSWLIDLSLLYSFKYVSCVSWEFAKEVWSHFEVLYVMLVPSFPTKWTFLFLIWVLESIWMSLSPCFSQLDKCPFQEADTLRSTCTRQPPGSAD